MRTAGYSVRDACEALGMSRAGYYWARKPRATGGRCDEARDEELLEEIHELKRDHPFWGYRRVWAWLKYRKGYDVINKKRVYRIMRKNGLLVPQTVHKAKRTPQRSKPRAEKPLEYWGIDMTKFLIPSVGWTYFVGVLDWYTKELVGWDLSLRSRTWEWKKTLDMGTQKMFPDGVRGCGLKLISDNGSQPTSTGFMRDTATLEIEQIFTSYDNPKGNADTERFMRTLKEEAIWLNEFTSLAEAKETIGKWIEEDYNKRYVHSALGYRSPEEFRKLYYEQEAAKKVA